MGLQMAVKEANPLATNDLETEVLNLISLMKPTGCLKTGANESAKILNKGNSFLVILAEDAVPFSITAHLPVLCEDKDVKYIYVKSKESLARACGLSGRSVIACTIYSKNEKMYEQIKKSVFPVINKIIY